MACRNGICGRPPAVPPAAYRPFCLFTVEATEDGRYRHTCQRCKFVTIIDAPPLSRRCGLWVPLPVFKGEGK
jgi:hypothetical protein